MAYAYHDDRARYFEHQCRVTADHVIPFVERSGALPAGARVLEIGCGEAGVLKAFLERGTRAVGVDKNARRLARGKEFHAAAIAAGTLALLHEDAAALIERAEYHGHFDLIVLKDVIEHIEDRPALFAVMAALLAPGGRVFMAFPPWRMPFGGHQQICQSLLLSRLPYFHLLPMPAYRALLGLFGEPEGRRQSLLDTKRTGISTTEFEGLVSSTGFRVDDKRLYLLNPMYAYRFGLRPVEQARSIAAFSEVADFVTTCAYYTLSPSSSAARASGSSRG